MDKQTILAIIETLLSIQERDLRIARCLREVNDIPNLKQAIEARLSRQKAEAAKAKETVNMRLVAIKEREIEIEDLRQQIAKLREQQFQIKSNEEFKVLNKEIAGLQEQIRELEDRELEFMEKAEEAQQAERALKAEIAKAEEGVRSELQQLDERHKSLNAEIQQLQQNRQGLTVGLPDDWLARYTRVMENRKDAALVSVEGNACGGCHMTLPPHVLQDVKRADTITACSFCGRLLYNHT